MDIVSIYEEVYFLMAKKDKKISQDAKLLGIGVGLLVVTLAIISTAFTFLINNALPALTTDDKTTIGGEIHFDLEGFEELGL